MRRPVTAKIYGPHFEDLARTWCLNHAAEETLGGVASSVLPTEIACKEHRGGHELDIVVAEDRAGGRIAAIGEAKATSDLMGVGQLRRLEHLRSLLPSARIAQLPKLLLFSRSGFSAELAVAAAARPDVELVALDRLYQGS